MNTKVVRIDMSRYPNLGEKISQVADDMLKDGFRLASTFCVEESLVLVFQKLA